MWHNLCKQFAEVRCSNLDGLSSRARSLGCLVDWMPFFLPTDATIEKCIPATHRTTSFVMQVGMTTVTWLPAWPCGVVRPGAFNLTSLVSGSAMLLGLTDAVPHVHAKTSIPHERKLGKRNAKSRKVFPFKHPELKTHSAPRHMIMGKCTFHSSDRDHFVSLFDYIFTVAFTSCARILAHAVPTMYLCPWGGMPAAH